MRRYTDRKRAEHDPMGRDTAKCTEPTGKPEQPICGHLLDFFTDPLRNGISMEACQRCGYSRPMQRAPHREQLDPLPTTPKIVVVGPCEDCGGSVDWRGMGSVPKRCTRCAEKRRKLQGREWNKRNRRRAA